MAQEIGHTEVQPHNIDIDPNRLLTGNRRELTHGLFRGSDLVVKFPVKTVIGVAGSVKSNHLSYQLDIPLRSTK